MIAAIALFVVASAMRGVGAYSFVVPAMAGATALVVTPRQARENDAARWLATTGVGVAAFAAVRFALPQAPMHATALAILASVVAAAGEELLFRHAMYAWLSRWGAPVAVVLAALAFGLVHAPMYGWSVVPVDVAAGVLFGWQRWATGGWTSPAATHVFANVMGAF
jgi:membrane protease YdiL (CAAX protease family)